MFTSLILAAAAAFPLFVSAAQSNCARTYTVQAGDFCDSISAAHNSSTYQLAAVNSAIDDGCTNLQVGQELCLGTTGEDCGSTYVVQPDDTCLGITNIFKINATMLYANNPQINSDCSNIYIGEVLCTLDQVRVPPAPANHPTSSVVVAPGTATAAPLPAQTPAEDLPECEDAADDGEW